MIQRSITEDYTSVYESLEEFEESNLYIKRMKEMAFSVDFVGDVMLPAHAYKGKKSCGEWQFKACLNHDRHVDGCSYCRKTEFHCNSIDCNTCFEHTIRRQARSISDRLTSFANLKKNRKIYMEENRVRVLLHNTLSPPVEEHYKFKTKEGRKELTKTLRKIEKRFDIDGGVTLAHPYRFTPDLKSAYWSPHYHQIVTGWIDGDIVKSVYEEFGWIVKQVSNFDSNQQCHNVVKYLLSHVASYLKDPLSRSSKQSYSYFGECQNRKFKVESVLKYSEDGYDQLNQIFQKKITKTIKGKDYGLRFVSSDYYQITDSIKNSMGSFEQYENKTADDLTKIYGKYITPKQQDLSIIDNPAITQSEPFEFIQMRLDYADSSGCIVQSEYLNIILNQNLKNLCPECTLNMRTIVPNSSFRYHKEDFEIIWNALDPDGKTMKVDSLHGFEDLSITNTMKGMPYVKTDGSWEVDTGVYELPEKFNYLPSQMRKTLERTAAYQEIKYLSRVDNDDSDKYINDLWAIVDETYAPLLNQQIGDFS